MVNKLDLDYRNFLSAYIKKGIGFEGLLSIRGSVIDHVLKDNKAILITAKGCKGTMVLTPDTILSKLITTSGIMVGKRDGKPYILHGIAWNPTNEETIYILDKLYILQRNFMEDLEKTINLVKKKL